MAAVGPSFGNAVRRFEQGEHAFFAQGDVVGVDDNVSETSQISQVILTFGVEKAGTHTRDVEGQPPQQLSMPAGVVIELILERTGDPEGGLFESVVKARQLVGGGLQLRRSARAEAFAGKIGGRADDRAISLEIGAEDGESYAVHGILNAKIRESAKTFYHRDTEGTERGNQV
jgi:hypothetical protein